ncbi:hypothetical protein ACTFIY_009177 [Dictyostelium cf. discoideum]
MPTDIKMIIKNNDGESTISGKAITLPTPMIFPPPLFIRFIGYKSDGKLWNNENFEINGGKVECNGEDYELVQSRCLTQKIDDDSENVMDIRIMPSRPLNRDLPYL